ncbi:tyrosine recombinase XerD [Oceaniferula spumae]|uniref:Tyrosine recombinase XerD n=1 Tax=Oceaniferula spumae TaxID=2979115 RepID=A0AAT9FQF9_9BACT
MPHAHLETALGDALEDWICSQRRIGLRQSSIAGRRTHIRLFIKWSWDRHITKPEWISRGLMEEWLAWLDEHCTQGGTPYAETSKESMIRSVNAFFGYLLLHHRIDSNPLAGTRLRRCNARSIPLVLDETQILHLLEMPATDDVLGLRDRAMMEVTYCTGMRRGETVGLRITDLIRGGSSIVVHNGKGGKERVVPLGGPAQYWLKRYLAEARPLLLLPDEPSDVLFLTSYGDGFSAGAWGHAVRQYLTKSGVTVKGGPHLLRHACATHMLDHGADLRTIQTLLGHSRVDTTEIYTHVSTGRLSSVHHSTHPRG